VSLSGKGKDDLSTGYFDSGDVTDALAGPGQQRITLTHIPTNTQVSFKAFLTEFNDSYSSNWNKTEVYGRMDPIVTFQGTERVITLGWDVVAFNAYEAYKNMKNVSMLLRMLYPVYEKSSGKTHVMTAAPLFKLKFMNLIQQTGTGMSGDGLIGSVSGFTYNPDINAGFFNDDDGSIMKNAAKVDPGTNALVVVRKVFEAGALLPQSINLSCTYTVMHTHALGWSQKDSKLDRANKKFPYNTYVASDPEAGATPAADEAKKPDPSPPVAAAAAVISPKGIA